MKICLYGKSSIEAWRRYDNRVSYMPVFGHALGAGPVLQRAFPSVQLEPGVPLSELGCDPAVVAAKDFSRSGTAPVDTLHLLADSRHRWRDAENCEIHTLAGVEDLPGLFLELEPGLCATSPELTFIVAARDLDLIDQILLGYELCGCYSLGSAFNRSLEMRHPLTCVERIEETARMVGRVKGVAQARRALQFVLDGSGSPQETALALMLCLPKKYGGFGLPRPQMNLSFKLGEAASAVWGRGNAFDLVWAEKKVVVEYDGREGHSTFEQVERDNTRRNALLVDGYTVFVLTKSQLGNADAMRSIVDAVADRLDFRLYFRDSNFWSKHLTLRDRILPSREFDLPASEHYLADDGALLA